MSKSKKKSVKSSKKNSSKKYRNHKNGIDYRVLTINVIAILMIAFLLSYLVFGLTGGITGDAIARQTTSEITGPPEIIQGFFDSLSSFFSPILAVILGSLENDDLIVAQILFVLLTLTIIWLGTSKIDILNDNTPGRILVSIILALLFTRWIATEGLLETVLMPYNAVGAGLSALIPFIVAFWFLEFFFKGNKWSIVRKVGWIFVAVFFIWYWVITYTQRGEMTHPSLIWIYPISAGLSFFMLLLDGTIQTWLAKADATKASAFVNRKKIRDLKRELRKLEEDYAEKSIEAREYESAKKEILEMIARLSR